jgi:hypothetical protein
LARKGGIQFFLMLPLQRYSRRWMVFLAAPLALIGVVPALLIFTAPFGCRLPGSPQKKRVGSLGF